jgi:hypothetical protein
MLTTGKIIAPFGGQSENVPSEQGRFWQHEYLDADTPDEVRKAVRVNIYYGANAIKLVADHNAYYFSTAEVRAAVEESHAAGLTCPCAVAVSETRTEPSGITCRLRNVVAGFPVVRHGVPSAGIERQRLSSRSPSSACEKPERRSDGPRLATQMAISLKNPLLEPRS